MDNFPPTRGMGNKGSHQPVKSMQAGVYHVIRWILGIIFIYASYDKILHPQAFALVVYNYQLLPEELINLTALILPWLELLLGVCLITHRLIQGTIIISNILLFTFTIIVFYNVHRGLDINCGCFSTDIKKDPATMLTIVRDVIFLIMSFYLYLFAFKIKKAHNR